MTHDNPTEGRTEAAAVDQATADVREKAERELKDIYRTRPIPYPAATFHALRVLADAVENARHLIDVEWPHQLDALETRAEAAEAENVRLARQVADLSAENESLRRERSSLEAALDGLLQSGGWGHSHWDSTGQHGAGCPTCIQQRDAKERARAALVAARSRDPQAQPSADREEPQT